MATPPFLPDETKPQDTDLITTYPSQSQTFRDVVESWLLLISTNMGVLRADAMPDFDEGQITLTQHVLKQVGSGDVELRFVNNAGSKQATIEWDNSDDNLIITMFADDATTPRSAIVLGGDSALFTFNGVNVITATSALATAITGTGALDAGSITSGFGSINIGADAITAGAASFTTGSFSSTLGVTGAATFSSTLAATGVITATGGIELQNTDTTLTRHAAGIIAVEGIPLYAGIPITDKSEAYTLVLADRQTAIRHPAADNNARTMTIPANGSVAYAIGTVLTFINEVNTMTIAINTDTLVLANAGTTGSRTLAANGIATAIKVASTRWYISGTGLT